MHAKYEVRADNPLSDTRASAFLGRASGFNVDNMITGKLKGRSDGIGQVIWKYTPPAMH